MTSSSRKLPRELECPIDNVLLDVVECLNPYFYRLGWTPNGITTLSALFGIWASILIWYNWYILASVAYFIGYFFDSMDGNFARQYHLTSKFGDMYDHIKDLVVSFSVMIILIIKHGFNPFHILLTVVFSVMFVFNNLYLGQQDAYFDGQRSPFLQMFTIKSTFGLHFLRYFGCGTLNLYVSLVIFHFSLRC
jgi:phosphatidylglycerophosphate synthase